MWIPLTDQMPRGRCVFLFVRFVQLWANRKSADTLDRPKTRKHPPPSRLFWSLQFVRVANQKEAAIAARNMVDFVEATIEMISINLADEEKGLDPYEKAVGGEWRELW